MTLDQGELPASVKRFLSKPGRDREIHEARIKARRDHAAELHDAREKGMLAGQILVWQQLLNLPVTSAEELLSLTQSELTALGERLSQQLDSRP